MHCSVHCVLQAVGHFLLLDGTQGMVGVTMLKGRKKINALHSLGVLFGFPSLYAAYIMASYISHDFSDIYPHHTPVR